MRRCERCGGLVRCTVADPVVTAPSLGKGFYHYECAKRQWGGDTNTSPPVQDAIDEVCDLAMKVLEGRSDGGRSHLG